MPQRGSEMSRAIKPNTRVVVVAMGEPIKPNPPNRSRPGVLIPFTNTQFNPKFRKRPMA